MDLGLLWYTPPPYLAHSLNHLFIFYQITVSSIQEDLPTVTFPARTILHPDTASDILTLWLWSYLVGQYQATCNVSGLWIYHPKG